MRQAARLLTFQKPAWAQVLESTPVQSRRDWVSSQSNSPHHPAFPDSILKPARKNQNSSSAEGETMLEPREEGPETETEKDAEMEAVQSIERPSEPE